MNKDQAKNSLRNISKTGCILTSRHCRIRMNERNVSTEDILNVIMWGEIEEIEYDDIYQNYKCRIKGEDLDGDELILHAAFSENEHSVLCITVY